MVSKIRELREQRVKIHADAQDILKKDKLTPEDRQKFDAMMAEMDTLKADIDRMELAEKQERELRETTRPPESPIGDPAGSPAVDLNDDGQARSFRRYLERGTDGLSADERRLITKAIEREEKHRRAFRDYLRNGLMPSDRERGMSAENRQFMAEFRDMGVGTGSLGGYFVPQGFVYDVETALKYYGNMLGVSTILDTATGNPLPYPTSNDTTITGEIVGEGTQVSDADDSLGHIIFGAYKFSTKMVKVSLELLQDSAFDMEAFLKDAFAIRLGRILNTKFTVGAGTTEPTGLITAATAGPTAVGSSANTGGAQTGGNSIGYVDLVELEHSVDPLYRRGAQFMMHDTTLKAIKEILDKYGRPLWVPGVATDAPDTILGYEYSIDNDMATIAVNAKTVAFGQLKKYLIRRVKELAVLRLVERFADYGQVAFIGFARYDGNLLDAGTHPVSYLVQASS
jgi:HK97 family phage major capsid protein